MKLHLNYIILLLSIMICIPINIYSYQEQSSIIEGTKNFIKKEVQNQYKNADLKSLNIKIINNNLINNKICNKAVNYSFPTYSNINKRATVIATCQDHNGWKIYIPVNIQFFASALSAKKSLPKAHVINKDDLIRQKINVLQLKDQYYTDPNDVVGLTLKSPIKQNTVLTSGLLKEISYGT